MRGRGLDTATNKLRSRSIHGLDTDMVTDKIRSRTDRDHGLIAVTVTVWTWTVMRTRTAAVWIRTGHGHGHQAGQWRGYFRLKPRRIRGQQSLENSRGEASTLKFTQIV